MATYCGQRSSSRSSSSKRASASACCSRVQSCAARVSAPNSLIASRLMPYLSDATYCIHRKPSGIAEVGMKTPGFGSA